MEFGELIKLSLTAIRANKLRSALTLLGIVVGVFSIIAVMTAVRVLQHSIEEGLSELGSNTFQIQKFPALFMGGHAQWEKFRNRKDITLEQSQFVADRMTNAMYIGLEAGRWGETVEFGSNKTNPNVGIDGETPGGIQTNNWTIKEGRSLTDDDQRQSRPVIILGQDVVKKIFPNRSPIGADVRVGSNKFLVIGVFESKGAAFGGSSDNFAVIPLSTFLDVYGKHRSMHIMVKAKSAERYDEAVEEARMILRLARKVEPGQPDDFEIFSNDSLISTFNEFTLYVKLGIGFISFVSLLAAGVGIMNIMLVSVTERTREIGIRKAVGARRMNILGQFIAEAIVLCQIGGIIGILLGILSGNLAALAFDAPPVFPLDWAVIGFVLCSIIGIIFGVYPAWKAANLDPIESLRYE